MAKKDNEYHEQTLEELRQADSMGSMQKIILAVAVIFLIAFIAYVVIS